MAKRKIIPLKQNAKTAIVRKGQRLIVPKKPAGGGG